MKKYISLLVVLVILTGVLVLGVSSVSAAGTWPPCPAGTDLVGGPFEIDLPAGEGIHDWYPRIDQNTARPGFQIKVFVCNQPTIVHAGLPSQTTHYQIIVRTNAAEETYNREPRQIAFTGGNISSRTQKAFAAFAVNGVLYMRGYSTSLTPGVQLVDPDPNKILTITWDYRHGNRNAIDPEGTFQVAPEVSVGAFSVVQGHASITRRVQLLMNGSRISRTNNSGNGNALTLFVLNGFPYVTIGGNGSPCTLHYPNDLILQGTDIELDARRMYNFQNIAPDLCVDRIP